MSCDLLLAVIVLESLQILYFPNEIIIACLISNCTEFGIIKIRIIQQLPLTQIVYRILQTHPLKDNMFLHLAMRHVCQRDVVLLVYRKDSYGFALNIYI